MKSIIVIGGRSGKHISAIEVEELLEQYHQADAIAFQTIGKLENHISKTFSFEGTIPEENMERLRNFGIEANKAGESFKRLADTLNSMKEPLENEPSKYISKPRNNFKRR